MANFRKPKCPSTLKGKTISNDLRVMLELPEFLLLSDYSNWDISAIVDDYFLFNHSPDETGHNLFQLTVRSLQSFIDNENSTNSEKSFAKKFLEYIKQPNSKKQFLYYYKDCERKSRLHNSIVRLEEEVEIAGNELVGDHLRDEVEKRKFSDLAADSDTRPMKIQIKSKTYTIQSPQNAAVLDSPLIEEANMSTLSRRVDICLRNSNKFASPELLEEYKVPQNDHRQDLNLSRMNHSLNLFNKFQKFEEDKLLDSLAEMTYEGSFNRFMKFSLIDFAVNIKRINPMPIMDERTIFVETVSQMFKYFGNTTGLLSFKW